MSITNRLQQLCTRLEGIESSQEDLFKLLKGSFVEEQKKMNAKEEMKGTIKLVLSKIRPSISLLGAIQVKEDQIIKEAPIGHGSYGIVWKGKKAGKGVAVKEVLTLNGAFDEELVSGMIIMRYGLRALSNNSSKFDKTCKHC
jgi:hypothetical protein